HRLGAGARTPGAAHGRRRGPGGASAPRHLVAWRTLGGRTPWRRPRADRAAAGESRRWGICEDERAAHTRQNSEVTTVSTGRAATRMGPAELMQAAAMAR